MRRDKYLKRIVFYGKGLDMKKELKLKRDETLYDWYSRLANYYAGYRMTRDELLELLREVSITSYSEGSRLMSRALLDDSGRK